MMVQRYRSIGARMQGCKKTRVGAYVAHSDYDNLTRQLAEANDKLGWESTRRCDDLLDQEAKFYKEIEQLRSDNARLRDEIAELKKEKEEWAYTCGTLQEQNARLREALQAIKVASSGLSQNIYSITKKAMEGK